MAWWGWASQVTRGSQAAPYPPPFLPPSAFLNPPPRPVPHSVCPFPRYSPWSLHLLQFFLLLSDAAQALFPTRSWSTARGNTALTRPCSNESAAAWLGRGQGFHGFPAWRGGSREGIQPELYRQAATDSKAEKIFSMKEVGWGQKMQRTSWGAGGRQLLWV